MTTKDLTFSKNVLLPLIQQAYVRVFEVTKGENPEKWSFIGKHEFGPFAPFSIPEAYEFHQTIEIQDFSLPFLSQEKKMLPFGFLLESNQYMLIILRGTVAPVEWINNGLVLQKEFFLEPELINKESPLSVHGGFLDIFKMVYTSLSDNFKLIEKSTKPLIIAGHSLGGAVAQLLALKIHTLQPTVFTYGSPRVGNQAFATTFNQLIKKSIRYVNGFDPVPALPPKLVIEAGKEIYKHTKKEVNIYAGIKKLDDWKQITHPDVIYSHLPTTYLKAIDNSLTDLSKKINEKDEKELK